MPQIQTRITGSRFGDFLNTMAIGRGLEEMQVYYPEPDYSTMAKHLAMVEKFATVLGQIDVLSDQDRENLKGVSIEAFKAVERIEQSIENIKALPENVTWRQKACTKLEHLANRIEDIVETSALAASKHFTRTIEAEVQSLMNVPADDRTGPKV